MFVVFFVHGPYCVFFCLQNRNVPQRMHLQDSVDEMKKFNARRKLKVIYMLDLIPRVSHLTAPWGLETLGMRLIYIYNHHFDLISLFFSVWEEWLSDGWTAHQTPWVRALAADIFLLSLTINYSDSAPLCTEILYKGHTRNKCCSDIPQSLFKHTASISSVLCQAYIPLITSSGILK